MVSGQLAWGPDNDSGGDITGSGTANTVTKFTSAKVIGDGPITFSSNDSTFAGSITTNLSSAGTYFTGGSGGVRQLSITSGTNISAHALHTFNIASSNGKYEFDVDGTTELSLDSSSATFAGQVGVAGKTPAYGLTLAQGTGVNNKIAWTDGTPNFRASIYANSSNDKFTIATGNASSVETTALEIDTSQNSTFAGNVSVIGSAKFIEVGSANTGTNFGFIGWNAASKYLFIGNSYNSAYNEDIIIDSSGNVGIGEDAPGTLLSLKGGADTSIITLKCTKNDSSWNGERIGGINFFSEDGSGSGAGIRGSINYVAASSSGGSTAMTFKTGDNTERMRIDNSGNVGIGTTLPSAKLHVNGVITANDSIQVQNDDSGFICRNAAGTVIGTVGAESSSTPNIGMFTVRDNGNNRIVLNANGNSYFNGGNVGIATTNPLVKLQVYGNAMPATGDAASVEDIFTLYRNGSLSVWSGGASLALGRYSTGGGSAPKSRLDFKIKRCSWFKYCFT